MIEGMLRYADQNMGIVKYGRQEFQQFFLANVKSSVILPSDPRAEQGSKAINRRQSCIEEFKEGDLTPGKKQRQRRATMSVSTLSNSLLQFQASISDNKRKGIKKSNSEASPLTSNFSQTSKQERIQTTGSQKSILQQNIRQ